MKKDKEFKITYVYHEPKTPQEKADQQRRLDQAFDIIFDKIFKDEKNYDSTNKKNSRQESREINR